MWQRLWTWLFPPAHYGHCENCGAMLPRTRQCSWCNHVSAWRHNARESFQP